MACFELNNDGVEKNRDALTSAKMEGSWRPTREDRILVMGEGRERGGRVEGATPPFFTSRLLIQAVLWFYSPLAKPGFAVQHRSASAAAAV